MAGDEGKYVSPEWWGHKFVSGGFLGAESRRKKSLPTTKRAAFHEEDQENLYKLVQVGTFLFIFGLNYCL